MELDVPLSPSDGQDRTARQPRARGQLAVTARRIADGRSALEGLRQAGCLKALFPRRTDRVRGVEAIVINTAGGLTGGDALEIDAAARPGATLTLTTQAAERAYGAQAGPMARLSTTLSAGAGARLNWLPQETILFERSALRRRLRVSLEADAGFLMVEPLIFGRAAMGETLRDIRFDDRVEIIRDGRPVYLDAARIAGDAQGALSRAGIAAGAGAMACVVFAAPGAHAARDWVRAALPATGGASLLADDLLVIRLLAEDGHALRHSLVPILTRLTAAPLPRSWTT